MYFIESTVMIFFETSHGIIISFSIMFCCWKSYHSSMNIGRVSLVRRQQSGCIPRLKRVVLISHVVVRVRICITILKGVFKYSGITFIEYHSRTNQWMSHIGLSLLYVTLFYRYGQSMQQASKPTLSLHVIIIKSCTIIVQQLQITVPSMAMLELLNFCNYSNHEN